MSERTYDVLFLCTGNSARSILAEAVLTRTGGGRFRAHSAGSQPKGEVHPLALSLLAQAGFDTSRLRSKSWDEFAKPGSPELDFVFTVCDHAAAEACPVWPGRPITAQWGVEDPAAFIGPDAEQRRVFHRVYVELSRRIDLFTSLPIDALDRLTLQTRLNQIAKGG